MKIQLYSNCILSARYTEVFRTQALLDTYLATLDKPIEQEIDIENVYTSLTGTITLDIGTFVRTFNYIKFTDLTGNNSRITYAFVDSFSFVNGLLVINYTQDIWHTYIGMWSLRNSLLINTYVLPPTALTGGHPYEMPISYVGNGVLDYNTDFVPTTSLFSILFKVQLYELTSGGSGRGIIREFYSLMGKFDDANTLGYTYGNIMEKVRNLANSQLGHSDGTGNAFIAVPPTQQGGEWTLFGPYFIRIPEIYIIPYGWTLNFGKSTSELRIQAGMGNSAFYARPITETAITVSNTNMYWACQNGTILPDKQILSYGFFTTQIPYSFDGMSHNWEVIAQLNNGDFHLYLKVNNITTEITAEFLHLTDYEIVTPDVLAQREIAKQQLTMKGIRGLINGGTNVASGVGGIIAGAYTGNVGAVIQGASNVGKGVGDLAQGAMDIEMANKPKYKTFDTTNNNVSAFINAIYGFFTTSIRTGNILNKDEADEFIAESGYKIHYFTNTLDINTISTYNVVRFDFVRITGLSTEICEKIATILTDGVKIWYTSDV